MTTSTKKPGKDIGFFILFTVLAMIATPILEMAGIKFPLRLIVLLAIVYIPFILIQWYRYKNIPYIVTLSLAAVLGMPLIYRFIWSISTGVTFTVFVFAALFLIINIIIIVTFNRKIVSSQNALILQRLENGSESEIMEIFDYKKDHEIVNKKLFKLREFKDLGSKILATRQATYDITSVQSISDKRILLKLKSKANEAIVLIDNSAEKIKILTLPDISKERENEVTRILNEVKLSS